MSKQPEPTIGQLVDAMHGEIERIQAAYEVSEPIVDIQIFGKETSFVRVQWAQIDILDKFDNIKYVTAKTPQAALRAMIERLREVK